MTALFMAMSAGLLSANLPNAEGLGPLVARQWGTGALATVWQDPTRMAKAGESCLTQQDDMQDCSVLLNRAVAGNSRQSDALLWLAFLAEQSGRNTEAERFYARVLGQDKSFHPLWVYWGFLARTGSVLRMAELDRQVILRAPPTFQAHYHMLWQSDWTSREMFDLLMSEGKLLQALSLVNLSVETNDPSSGPLLGRLLHNPRVSDLPLTKLRQNVLRVVAQGISDLRPIHDAEHIWTTTLDESDTKETLGRILTDKREFPVDHPLWNYNPSLRLPFVPQSFDWSMIQSADGNGAALSERNGGIRIRLRAGVTKPLVLLARVLPTRDATSSLRFTTEWGASSRVRCPNAVWWELRSRDGAEVFAKTKVTIGADLDVTQNLSVDYELPIDGKNECLQLMLMYSPPPDGTCLSEDLSIHRIRLNGMGIREGAALTERKQSRDGRGRSS